MKGPVITSVITRISGNHVEKQDDLLVVEEPLEIRITSGPRDRRQEKNISVTMRTPGEDKELALGFLFTEGIITSINDVDHVQLSHTEENIVHVELSIDKNVDLDSLQRNFYTTSSCGVCGKASIDAIMVKSRGPLSTSLIISPEALLKTQNEIIRVQKVFGNTGGIHASALVNKDGSIELIREDIGRHNALDKLIGALLVENKLPIADNFVFLSGRAGFELVQKAAMAGVQILAAVGAPSSLSVEFASECGMTLLGFVREDRFNIYCGEKRIRL
jgi:FdhD protein